MKAITYNYIECTHMCCSKNNYGREVKRGSGSKTEIDQ